MFKPQRLSGVLNLLLCSSILHTNAANADDLNGIILEGGLPCVPQKITITQTVAFHNENGPWTHIYELESTGLPSPTWYQYPDDTSGSNLGE
jgi:hypothetical protein